MDSSLQIELNVDSLEWMNLTLEIQQELGVELSEDAISRVQIVRDLLNEVVQASESGSAIEGSPLENPEDFIDEKRKQYVQPLNKGQEVLAHSLFNTVYGIMHTFFRIESVGFDKLPKKKQLVFIPNHASYLDAFAVIGVLPYDRLCNTQIAGWQGISFANPFNSFISRLAQTFPIEAKRSLITSLALGAAVLKNGKSMIWFPEGERTLTGDLLKFKPGIGTLLDKYDDVSVVPIYLDGTRHALPPGSPFPRFCKIKVWFGTPATARELEKQGEGRTPAERISNALKDRVQELADKARAEKQKTRG